MSATHLKISVPKSSFSAIFLKKNIDVWGQSDFSISIYPRRSTKYKTTLARRKFQVAEKSEMFILVNTCRGNNVKPDDVIWPAEVFKKADLKIIDKVLVQTAFTTDF